MRKIVLFMHVSLDGFVAGLKGEMDWIRASEELFDFAGRQTDKSDMALYGRKTYEMMQFYWPTAGDKPDASRHDKEHSAWYNKVEKVVISKTLEGQHPENTQILSNNIYEEVSRIKARPGGDIVIFGSPSAVHVLMADDLIDEYWLFINPMLLGEGIPLFKNIKHRIGLKLAEQHVLASGVVALKYEKA